MNDFESGKQNHIRGAPCLMDTRAGWTLDFLLFPAVVCDCEGGGAGDGVNSVSLVVSAGGGGGGGGIGKTLSS